MHPGPAASSLQTLAARWQVFALALLALARQVSLAHKSGAQSGIRKAEAAEAALYASLVMLSADIAEHSRAEKSRAHGDEDALRYLKAAHSLLSVTALLIAALKRDLILIAERIAALGGAHMVESARAPIAALMPDSYLDSS